MFDFLRRAVAAGVCLVSLVAIGVIGSERDRQTDPRVLLLRTLLGIPICVASFACLHPRRKEDAETQPTDEGSADDVIAPTNAVAGNLRETSVTTKECRRLEVFPEPVKLNSRRRWSSEDAAVGVPPAVGATESSLSVETCRLSP